MGTDDVWIITIPANMKIEKCVRELARDDDGKHAENAINNSCLQEDNVVYLDSKQKTKKYYLTYNYLLDCIPVNED